jgi:type I pantothenate kinase
MPSDLYFEFSREEWSRLRANTPLVLTEAELSRCRGVNEEVRLEEVSEVYLPLSRLLNLHVIAAQALSAVTGAFLGAPSPKAPYIVAIAGSVAVGKSTTSRILQALLRQWPDHPRVDLVTTDGFLFPNAVLEERGLMSRKGFPESYDRKRLVTFVSDIKAGKSEVSAPVYSHVAYDIVAGAVTTIHRPQIVIIEGLNVLQNATLRGGSASTLVSDYIDFSIYVDAREEDIQAWYVERFLLLRATVFQSETSYFHRYASLSETEARATAVRIWHEINALNLRENILPTRERANLILSKRDDHAVGSVSLRRL